MAELSNIQTYEKLVGKYYQPILDRFKIVLQRIDLWNDIVKEAFDSFEWKIEDNGFVYPSIMRLDYFKTKFSDIPVRPSVMVYTPAIDNSITDNWVGCELLIKTEMIRRGEYLPSTYDFIRSLAIEMQIEFKQTGIYFTDEAQDGQDFDGIRGDKDKLWQFDYALIPLTLETTYLSTPTTHKIVKNENYLEAFYIDRWTPKKK